MRYITKEEFESLLWYRSRVAAWEDTRELGPAILSLRRLCPYTRDDKYLTVGALYNLSRWSSWKSSSLGHEEMEIAKAIGGIPFHSLIGAKPGKEEKPTSVIP